MQEIRIYQRLLLLVTSVFLITLTLVVFNYEFDPTPIVLFDIKKTYSANEIRGMIKKLPTYQGDSLIIDESGRLFSLDAQIQSTLIQVYINDINFKGVKQQAKLTGEPEPYLVYKIGIVWYIDQYGDRRKKN